MAEEKVVEGIPDEEVVHQSSKELRAQLDDLLQKDYKLQEELTVVKDKRKELSEEMHEVTLKLTSAELREAGDKPTTSVQLGHAKETSSAKKGGN